MKDKDFLFGINYLFDFKLIIFHFNQIKYPNYKMDDSPIKFSVGDAIFTTGQWPGIDYFPDGRPYRIRGIVVKVTREKCHFVGVMNWSQKTDPHDRMDLFSFNFQYLSKIDPQELWAPLNNPDERQKILEEYADY